MVAPLFPTLRVPQRAVNLSNWFEPLASELENAQRKHALRGHFSSPVAIWEENDKLYVEVDMPGVLQEDLEVTVHDGKLVIRGQRKREESDGRNFVVDKVRTGEFEHVLSLPETIEASTVEAQLHSGVLSISLAKKPEVQPQKVEIKGG